jgi:rhodanese-related sulfurtransferase
MAGSVSPVAIDEVSVDELASALDAGARVFDVREPHEYTEGHVPGAVLVPLGTVDDQVDAFRGEGPMYVICKSGGRSMRALQALAAHDVVGINVAGGTLAWIDSGRAVVVGDSPA